jgi:hypothetical protein
VQDGGYDGSRCALPARRQRQVGKLVAIAAWREKQHYDNGSVVSPWRANTEHVMLRAP